MTHAILQAVQKLAQDVPLLTPIGAADGPVNDCTPENEEPVALVESSDQPNLRGQLPREGIAVNIGDGKEDLLLPALSVVQADRHEEPITLFKAGLKSANRLRQRSLGLGDPGLRSALETAKGRRVEWLGSVLWRRLSKRARLKRTAEREEKRTLTSERNDHGRGLAPALSGQGAVRES
jgi:hypothetical protein